MGQVFQLNGGGQLTLREEGVWVRLEAVRPNDAKGLYKVWLHGDGGRMLLGTLAPEGEGLRLRRRLSRSELEQRGCWPVAGGEAVLAFAFESSSWQQEEHPERRLADCVLRSSIGGRPMLLRRREDGFCLASPYDPGRPFPLTALFCLSRLERVSGKPHAVFYFDREGNPVAPHNGRHDGENSGTS